MNQIPSHFDEVGPGWRSILKDLHISLLVLAPRYQVELVKEKFGGLRVYLLEHSEHINAVIRVAEDRAKVTCEQCGAPGTLRRWCGSWRKTLCDDHA